MKFWFCETCGKRLSEKDLEDGSARNKKLKGVFCQECSVGVMTMEMDAVKVEELAKAKPTPPLSDQSETRRPLRRASGVIRTRDIPQRHPQSKGAPEIKNDRFPKPLAIGAVIVVVGIAVFALKPQASPHVRVNQPAQASKPSLIAEKIPSTLPAANNLDQPQSVSAPGIPKKSAEAVNEILKKPLPDEDVQPTALPAPAKPAEPAATPQATDVKPPDPVAQPTTVAPFDKGRDRFAVILKELAPILRQNHFAAAQELLDTRRSDPAFVETVEMIDKEKSDLAEVQSLRNRAMEMLRSKSGTVVTLRKGTMTGKVKTEANKENIALALKDGPELTVSASQLDADDVCNLVSLDTGAGKAEELRRRGLLFLAAGETGKAEDCFTRARDAGPGNVASPYLERIAALKREEIESAALEAWKNAESLFAAKNLKAAKKAYETLQQDYARSVTLSANADTLKNRLEAIEDAFGPPKLISLDIDGLKMELVLIPAGEFMMGSSDGDANERPVHKAKISKAFYMGKYPVTQAQYEKVMDKNPSSFKGKDLPVDNANFIDAESFCKKAGTLSGKTVRLPSEAEWEYACRAGTKSRFNIGDNDAALGQAGWYDGNSENKTHPVGQKKPNGWGLYDMHGNVWQWCQDWYGEDYYAKSPAEDPEGPTQGIRRVMRGGSCSGLSEVCRSAERGRSYATTHRNDFGFRVVVPAFRTP